MGVSWTTRYISQSYRLYCIRKAQLSSSDVTYDLQTNVDKIDNRTVKKSTSMISSTELVVAGLQLHEAAFIPTSNGTKEVSLTSKTGNEFLMRLLPPLRFSDIRVFQDHLVRLRVKFFFSFPRCASIQILSGCEYFCRFDIQNRKKKCST